MGVQLIGPKKTRRAEQHTGLTINRLLRINNHEWEARILEPNGHRHLRIDTATWNTHPQPVEYCWTTCLDLPDQTRRRL